jgi:hypothetical protein
MISNDEQLRHALKALEHLYVALAALRRDILPQNEANFALMAEGPVDMIRKLGREIDEYVGLSLAEELDAKHWGHLQDEDTSEEPVRTSERRAARG